MPPITDGELAAVCRAADPETVAGFVADLYEARDRTVHREAGAGGADAASFVVGDARERVVVPGDGPVPADADAVVVAGRSADAAPDGTRVIDAGRLRNALCYAVDRDAADRLLDRWFDRSLSSFDGGGAVSPPDATGADATAPSDGAAGTVGAAGAGHGGAGSDGDGGGSAGGSASPAAPAQTGGRRPAALAVAALAVLIVAAAVVGLAVGLSPATTPGFAAGNATDTATVTPLASSPTATSTTGPEEGAGAAELDLSRNAESASGRRPGGQGERTASAELTQLPNFMSPFPPGVDRTGIADYQRLVDANREQLAGQSYRVSLVYREFVDGETTAVSIQTVQVENATHYRGSRMRFGRFESPGPQLFEGDVYADGTTRFERTDGSVRRAPVAGSDRVLGRLSQFLGWYLSVEESWIADRESGRTTTTVRIGSEGDPWPGVTNATGDAIVADSGLVRVVRRAYDEPDSDVRVVVTVRVSDVGRTTVTRPPWVTDSSSAT